MPYLLSNQQHQDAELLTQANKFTLKTAKRYATAATTVNPLRKCANQRNRQKANYAERDRPYQIIIRRSRIVSRAPASIRRDATRAKNKHVNFRRTRIVVESQL